MPAAEGADALAAKLERHEHWPICSVHLWFDREITALDHAVLLDREIHWMYNKSRLQPWRKRELSRTRSERITRNLPHSAARKAIEQAVSELAEFFPAAARGKARKGRAGKGDTRHLRRASRN